MQSIHQVARVTLAVLAMSLLLAPSESASRPKLDVPFVPTPEAVVARMLELAKIQPNEYVIDLGSGDGRIAIAAAKQYQARAMGVDIDPVRVNEARTNAQRAGVGDRVTFRVENLFQTDIGRANVLTMYLLDRINRQLRPRILEQMQPGARVVSHAFSMGDWEPDILELVSGRSVYFWVVPARVGGRWKFDSGDTALTMDIDQQFQNVSGKAQIGERNARLHSGRINGEEIRFMIDGRNYRGRVNGNTMEGEGGQTGDGPWRAVKIAG